MNKQKIEKKPGQKVAREYKFEIPSREAILKFLTDYGQPCGLRGIADGLHVDEKEPRKALRRRLRAMQRDGQVLRNRKNGYALVKKVDLLPGRVIAHPDGYGFMVPDEGGNDLFLSPREMRAVLHGDRVLARISGVDQRGRREGSIVEVLEHKNKTLVGRYFREGGIGFLTPDNKRIHQDILLPGGNEGKAKPGDIVVVDIIKQPDIHTQPVGKVIEILGAHMSAEMAVDIAIRNYELPREWSDEVQAEIKHFTEEVKQKDIKGREDLRDLPLVTIDSEDARDFDDAVYCEKQGSGWRLLVAIADVSSYVGTDMVLDEAARERGTSVYFPRRVVPMLPEILSNGLCSLKPKVDRLCLVCELNFDGKGKVKKHRFFPAVMRSAARLTYTEVAAMLVDQDQAVIKNYQALLPHLKDLYALYQILNERRRARGLLEFDSAEASIEFDEQGAIETIRPYPRNDAHRLIEEFMLAANVAAAETLLKEGIPSLFRVHETPKVEKLTDLRSFLSELGLQLGGGEEPTAADYAKLMQQIHEREDVHLIQTVLLRSMPLAVYSADNEGHFGLAFPAYTHYTSPIRRYPDLLVHRAIYHLLEKGTSEGFHYNHAQMQELGDHCSFTERRAEEASREVVQWYKCQYMHEKVGEEFNAIISSVTSFGLFVELDDIFIEGLVHVTSLPIDYYHFDAIGHRLRGEKTNRVFRLADRVKVKVMRVDLDDKKIDFELVEG